MRIVPGSVADHREALAPLLAQHAAELATHPHLMRLAPDWERYAMLERAGLLFCLYALDDDDRLIGYSCTLVAQHLHYSDLRYAQNDVLFVAAEHRKGRVGLALIQATEAAAKERGARILLWHAKQGTALEALLPRLGYAVQDVMFGREV